MKIIKFPYDKFLEFIDVFLVQGKSYLQNEQPIIANLKPSVDKVYEALCQNKDKNDNENKDLTFVEVVNNIKKEDNANELLLILNHALSSGCFPNSRKTHYEFNREENIKDFIEIPSQNVGGAGSGYVQTKTNGIRFIVYLFKYIVGNNINKTNVVDTIINWCKEPKYGDKLELKVPDGVKNFLLHLCDPDKYEPIASTSDKEKIVKAFEWLDGVDTNETDIDKKLESIHEHDFVKSIINEDTFYSNHFPLLWKGEIEKINSNLSRVQLLEYKKAMVLYGPPGTGKTFTAMELAKEILVRSVIKAKRKNLSEDLMKLLKKIIHASSDVSKLLDNDNVVSDHIHYLQFHINYNYEDFIAGQTMDNNGIETKEGFMIDILKKVEDENKTAEENQQIALPHIIILDEMNRVDVSRVFGELLLQ